MKKAKVQLSAAEIGLFANADIILTKNHILQQTKLLLEALLQQMQQKQTQLWQGESLFNQPPKVSRGENYRGLPYLVLDYPREFGSRDIFAIRSLFWWGHFFSSTLHLSGIYRERFQSRLLQARPILAKRDYFIHAGEDPWAHHFENGNYLSIKALSPEQFSAFCHRQAPIKIAAKWPLEQWPFAANTLFDSWELLLRICLD